MPGYPNTVLRHMYRRGDEFFIMIDTVEVQIQPNAVSYTLDLFPGDLYVAGRNTGPHLLTCKKHDIPNGWVTPTCDTYPFDSVECYKVVDQ